MSVLSSMLGISGIAGCQDPTPVDVCGDALPMEGTLCEHEGQECTPDEMGCGLYTGVRCEAGVWVFFEVGTGVCTGGSDDSAATAGSDESAAPVVPCGDEVPEEGTLCEQDGEDCAPGRDPCAGYVGAMCSAGAWKRYEVGPGDPETCAALDCAEICAATVAANCPEGPADAGTCADECEAQAAGPCKEQFSQAIACGPQPLMFACDEAKRPVIPGCEAQFVSLHDCLE